MLSPPASAIGGPWENQFEELGYRDYLGALQRYRGEYPREVELLLMSAFLIDYPFGDRLFRAALAHDPTIAGAFPPADATIQRIADLLDYDLPRICSPAQARASKLEATR